MYQYCGYHTLCITEITWYPAHIYTATFIHSLELLSYSKYYYTTTEGFNIPDCTKNNTLRIAGSRWKAATIACLTVGLTSSPTNSP